MNVVVFADTDIDPRISISLRSNEAVTADAVGLQIATFVTTAVVAAGVVYRVVVLVAAAVRARTLDVTAISYCTFR